MVNSKYFILSHSCKAIKDWFLLIIVTIIVTVDILILLIGTAIPQSRLEATKIRDREHHTSISVSNKIIVYSSSVLFQLLHSLLG